MPTWRSPRRCKRRRAAHTAQRRAAWCILGPRPSTELQRACCAFANSKRDGSTTAVKTITLVILAIAIGTGSALLVTSPWVTRPDYQNGAWEFYAGVGEPDRS